MTDPVTAAGPTLSLRLGAAYEQGYGEAAAVALEMKWAERIHDRDGSVWSMDPDVQAAIAERLGWLDAPNHFAELIPALEAFGEGVLTSGFTFAVVAGMGGSSLAPDVLNRTFGTAEGWLGLRILDSTDPVAVAATLDDLDPLATLFIVSSKSGTTTEPLAFLADQWDAIRSELEERRIGKPGDFVAAISDPGKSVESIPHHDEFREFFLNPPDIGGRYSALTYVGLAPASLIGLDLDPLLASATAMLGESRDADAQRNAALALGLAIGTLARDGRDKLTIVADPEIASFGAWLEQLLAESTGKHGVGIVPVDLEPLGEASAYGPDRTFVRIALGGSTGALTAAGRPADDLIDELQAAGHPVIRIDIPEAIDLGGEFVRWEFATAVAGAVLKIDPFDQPNVEEAKEKTRDLLAAAGMASEVAGATRLFDEAPGAILGGGATDLQPEQPSVGGVLAQQGPLTLLGDTAMNITHGDGTAPGELRRHLARLKPTGYAALQAYIAPTAERDEALANMRILLRDATGRATTLGYGPRFLHSTGQLHKGGPPTGWFLQLTADHPEDREIPGWPYTFGQLIDAQAAGDFQTLEAHDLPVLRVHLGDDPDAGLAALTSLLTDALGTEGPAA